MKKYLVFLFLFLPLNIFAAEITFNSPIFNDIAWSTQQWWLTNQRIFWDTVSWIEYCEYQWYTYVTQTNASESPANRARFDGFQWNWQWSNNVIDFVICDDNQSNPWGSSWSSSSTGSITWDYDELIYLELVELNNQSTIDSNKTSFIIEFYIFMASLMIFMFSVKESIRFFRWLEPKWNILRFFSD